jgi:hypothetical protein
VEGIILKGADATADRVAGFALVLLGGIDGRVTDFDKALAAVGGAGRTAGRGRATASTQASTTAAAAKPKASGAKAAAASATGTSTPRPAGSRARTTRAAG